MYISILMAFIGLALIIYLADCPFGVTFNLSVSLFFIATVLTLSLISITWIKAKTWLFKLLAIPVIILNTILILTGLLLASGRPAAYTLVLNSILKLIPEENKAGLSAFPYRLTKEDWKEDLNYLKTELPRRHANLFLYLKQSDFESAIENLEFKLGDLSDQQFTYEFCRLIAMFQDGHTQIISVPFGIPPLIDNRLFPLRLLFLKDGIYVSDGGRDHKDLTGLKLVQIGKEKTEDILTKIFPYVPGENKYYKMQWAFPYFLNAGLLNYVQAIEKKNKAEFTFINKEGTEIKRTLKPVWSFLYLRWFRNTLSLDDLSGRNRLDRNYWMESIDHSNTIFVQINNLSNQNEDITFLEFVRQLETKLNQSGYDRLIIDLRNCNGGNNTILSPWIDLISNHEKINQYGKLYTLIGRQTFSAGISLAAALERNTNTLFMGEPAGSGPNQCGDVQTLTLPHSKLILQVSSRYHQQSHDLDRRLSIEPSIWIDYTFKDCMNKIDPAISLIKNQAPSQNRIDPVLSEVTIAPCLGKFQFDEEKTLNIIETTTGLRFEINDYKPFAKGKLIRANDLQFHTASSRIGMEFIENKNNKYQRIILDWSGTRDTLMRLPTSYLSPAELILSGQLDEAILRYNELKTRGFHFPASTEFALNAQGYKFVHDGKLVEAIKLFELNTNLFPFSGNAWDSLAETLLKKGDTEKAKKSYQKSLELNPENETARKYLQSTDY